MEMTTESSRAELSSVQRDSTYVHERRADVSTCERGCGVGLETMQNTCVVDRKRVELWEIHQCT